MPDVLLKNANLVLPDGVFKGALVVDNGKISAIVNDANAPVADRIIDANGNYVVPGAIDAHSHIGYPDWPLDESVNKDTVAAAFGGVTTVIQFIFEPGSLVTALEKYKGAFRANSRVDYLFYLGIFDEAQIEEIPTVFKMGVPGFKFLFPYRGSEAMGTLPGIDDGILYLGFKQISKLGFPARALFHPENVEPFFRLKPRLLAMGRNDLAAWAEARPNFLEEEAYNRGIFFSHRLNCPLHAVHISVAGSIPIVRKARAEGVDLKVCVQTQYLTLSDKGPYGIKGKVNPPLRPDENFDALWNGLRDGAIDMVGSDHAPVPLKYKQNLWDANVGIPNQETYYPALVSEGVSKGRITMERLAEVTATNVARIHGIYPRKGALIPGADADIVILDLKKEVTITLDTLHQTGDYTPYEGWKLRGYPILAMLRGHVIMEDGQTASKPGEGSYIDFHEN